MQCAWVVNDYSQRNTMPIFENFTKMPMRTRRKEKTEGKKNHSIEFCDEIIAIYNSHTILSNARLNWREFLCELSINLFDLLAVPFTERRSAAIKSNLRCHQQTNLAADRMIELFSRFTGSDCTFLPIACHLQSPFSASFRKKKIISPFVRYCNIGVGFFLLLLLCAFSSTHFRRLVLLVVGQNENFSHQHTYWFSC